MVHKLPLEDIKTRNILVRLEEKGEWGECPEERSVERLINYGLVCINKPKGPTSHQVSSYVQKILGLNKSGHSGTLDPSVTGLLPIALGKGTRAISALLPAGKEYVALMHLHKDVSEDKIRKTFKNMTGRIMQLPPIKSAIKRQLRPRKVYYIDVMELDEKDVLFRIGCEAGTYIRKYIHDFGQKVSAGAHMQQLIRTRVSHLTLGQACTLQDLADAMHYLKDGDEKKIREHILPIEVAVEHMPSVWVRDSAIISLMNGADLNVPGISKIHDNIEPDQKIAIKTLKGELLGLGVARLTSKKMLEEEKGIAVRIDKVLYPKS